MKSKGIKKIFRSSKSNENDVLHHTRKGKRRTEPKETDLIFINNGDNKDRFLYALKAIFGWTSPQKFGIKKSKEKNPKKHTKIIKPLKDKLKKDITDKSIISDSSNSICSSSTTDDSSSSSSYSRSSSIASSSNSSIKEKNIWSTNLKNAPTTLYKDNGGGGCHFGKEVGICLIIVSLLVSLIWGKLIAIGCSSLCLVLLLLIRLNK